MSPLLINILLFGAVVLTGTILGALAFVGMGYILRSPVDPGRAHGSSFVGSLVAAAFYSMLLRFMDKPQESLLNEAFYIAAAAGLAVSFVAVMKAFEVDPAHVPLMWLPFAAVLATAFYLSRTLGNEWREANGFYRGYEGVASLNMLDPPNAMSTPEKAVDYYNNEFSKLAKANEDEGIGKIMTTQSHWDAKWFNDNYPYIVKAMSKRDPFGLTKILQDPKQHRVLALSRIARPIYGKVDRVHREGNEALVLMTSGQLVRLHKEGKNWKVRDWLGMRPLVMEEIYELKEANKDLSPEDKLAFAKDFKGYEEETRQMAERAGFPYTPFVRMLIPKQNDEAEATFSSAAGKQQAPRSRTGYRRLDAAPPGALIDLRKDEKETAAPMNAGGEAVASGPSQQENEVSAQLWTALFQALAKIDRDDPSGTSELLSLFSQEDRQWVEANAAYLAEIANPGIRYTPEQAQVAGVKALARTMPRQAVSPPQVFTRDSHAVARMLDAQQRSHVTLLTQENGKWVLTHPFFARTYVWLPHLANFKKQRNLPLGPDEQAVLSSGLVPLQQQVQKIYDYVGFKP